MGILEEAAGAFAAVEAAKQAGSERRYPHRRRSRRRRFRRNRRPSPTSSGEERRRKAAASKLCLVPVSHRVPRVLNPEVRECTQLPFQSATSPSRYLLFSSPTRALPEPSSRRSSSQQLSSQPSFSEPLSL